MSASKATENRPSNRYDVVGLGLGPSNLALMATLEEESVEIHGRLLDCLCVERKPSFIWHPGMLLEGAQIQLSFLKDLVTLRNPRSRFTFLNYLHEQGRLNQFANLRTFYPTRYEFNGYYSWVADQLRAHVRYSSEVTAVEAVPSEDGERIEWVKVAIRDLGTGESDEILTRNLVVATGGVPSIPEGVELGGARRVFHSHDFLPRVREEFPDRNHPYRFVVVGSGQSAAEIFEHLFHNYPNADVTAALRRFAYQPADDSHFVNEIFFPEMEDFLFQLPEEKRQLIIDAHRGTNYSAVDLDLIKSIYHLLYDSEVAGEKRARIQPFLELERVTEEGSEVKLDFVDIIRDEPQTLQADGAILATGFDRPRRHPLIDGMSGHFQPDGSGGYRVDRSYRIETREGFIPQIFLQGFCEDTYGLSDTLLSTLPIRALYIVRALLTEEKARRWVEERPVSA